MKIYRECYRAHQAYESAISLNSSASIEEMCIAGHYVKNGIVHGHFTANYEGNMIETCNNCKLLHDVSKAICSRGTNVN